MSEIILKEENGQVLASSRDVAEKFGNQHNSVLKTIYGENRKGEHINGLADEILASGNPLTKYFIESEYENRGKKYKECLMTRDGFSLVVMGFTGNNAIEWKLKYIDAFNKMEEELRKQSSKALPTTYKEALLQLLEQVEKNEKLEEERKILLPKADYHDEVLKKDGLITTTVVAKDLGFKSAAKLNQIMFLNNIIFKNKSGTWCPYADYEWLITDGYADYQSYENEHSKPCLKWTEKGRKWIVENYNNWVMKLVS